jgi:hypothetical protein
MDISSILSSSCTGWEGWSFGTQLATLAKNEILSEMPGRDLGKAKPWQT